MLQRRRHFVYLAMGVPSEQATPCSHFTMDNKSTVRLRSQSSMARGLLQCSIATVLHSDIVISSTCLDAAIFNTTHALTTCLQAVVATPQAFLQPQSCMLACRHQLCQLLALNVCDKLIQHNQGDSFDF